MHNLPHVFRIFRATYGDGPWPCYFNCGATVDGLRNGRQSSSGVIHHIDDDHDNDTPSNLAAAHYGCHSRHHATDPSAMTRARRGQSLVGHRFWGKKVNSLETRQRMSEAASRRWARQRGLNA